MDVNSDDTVIPWTIVNKYYTADVHFSVQDVAGLLSPVDEGTKVPAIVYVFDRREVITTPDLVRPSGLQSLTW